MGFTIMSVDIVDKEKEHHAEPEGRTPSLHKIGEIVGCLSLMIGGLVYDMEDPKYSGQVCCPLVFEPTPDLSRLK